MSKITILNTTTKNPISLIGERAGICWGADITDPEKNYKRGMNCILSDHGRTLEYVMVDMVLDGYSARVIREWYTHIGGSPTRLQASTRYINYNDFECVTPHSIEKNDEALSVWESTMQAIKYGCRQLEKLGIPREDIGMSLPLGMTTKVVDHRNLRNLVEMSRKRMCNRAFWEYRQIMHDICVELSKVSDEWTWIVENLFKAQCDVLGYCPESKSCGKYKKKE